MVSLTRDHAETCNCWKCESRQWFFEPPREPKRVTVPTDEVAAKLRRLGLSERALAPRGRDAGEHGSLADESGKAGAAGDGREGARVRSRLVSSRLRAAAFGASLRRELFTAAARYPAPLACLSRGGGPPNQVALGYRAAPPVVPLQSGQPSV